jgi:hypothetical protein
MLRGRHCEYDVEIRGGQQTALRSASHWARARPLAFWAVPVTATAVGDADQAAVIAALDMAAKSSGTADLDGSHNAALLQREPSSLRGTESVAVAAEDVRHLQCRTHGSGLVGRQ